MKKYFDNKNAYEREYNAQKQKIRAIYKNVKRKEVQRNTHLIEQMSRVDYECAKKTFFTF